MCGPWIGLLGVMSSNSSLPADRPLRIALVSFEYPPFHGGGIGTYAGIMSRWLAQAGHEVHVIANGWDETFAPVNGEPEHPNGLRIHRVRALDRNYEPCEPHDRLDDPLGNVARHWEKALYWSFLVAQELSRVTREYSIDVVEFPECFAEGYTAFKWRETGIDLQGLAMCVHLHTPIQDHTELNLARTYETWFRRRVMMEEYCITQADRLASPSRSLAEIVSTRLGLDEDRHPCDVIPYAMDLDGVPRRNGGSENEDPELLFVGRIEPRKGVRDLVDAAVQVMAGRPSLKVHLLGKDCLAGEAPGSMIDFLRARIPADLQDHFVFEGLRPREEVLQRYSNATACVFAAPWDNFPFTCFEAMAGGACIVASDQGGMAEVIEHESSGLIFEAQNVTSLAATIRRVLDEPALADRMRDNAVKRIATVCDPPEIVRRRVEHYRKAVDKRPIADDDHGAGDRP